MRRFRGWEPATRYYYNENGVLTHTRKDVEWDPVESGIMVARAILERNRCTQCGGKLTDELTTDPPYDDHYEYGHRIEESWCRGCVAVEKWRRLQAPVDESLENSPADLYPSIRRISVKTIPLPPRE